MLYALSALVILNTLGIFRADIRSKERDQALKDDLVVLITGHVRREGPILAQVKAEEGRKPSSRRASQLAL